MTEDPGQGVLVHAVHMLRDQMREAYGEQVPFLPFLMEAVRLGMEFACTDAGDVDSWLGHLHQEFRYDRADVAQIQHDLRTFTAEHPLPPCTGSIPPVPPVPRNRLCTRPPGYGKREEA